MRTKKEKPTKLIKEYTIGNGAFHARLYSDRITLQTAAKDITFTWRDDTREFANICLMLTHENRTAIETIPTALFVTTKLLFSFIDQEYLKVLYALNDKYFQKLLDHPAEPIDEEEEAKIIEEELMVQQMLADQYPTEG